MSKPATRYLSRHSLNRPVGARVARRDRLSAFNQLVLEHRSMVFNLAYRILGNPNLATTATENTFLRALRGFPKCHDKSPRLWLMRTAVAVCQEQLRQMPIQSSDSYEPSAGDNAHETVTPCASRQPSCDGAQAFLNTLSPDQRVTLVLSDVQGLSYREIAGVTGASVDVIQSHLSRGRTALRNALFAQGELPPGGQL